MMPFSLVETLQVAEKASSLNSGDSFVLLTPTEMFIWVGSVCSPEETDVAMTISEVSDRVRMDKTISLSRFVLG